jgi:hypothetical protein
LLCGICLLNSYSKLAFLVSMDLLPYMDIGIVVGVWVTLISHGMCYLNLLLHTLLNGNSE